MSRAAAAALSCVLAACGSGDGGAGARVDAAAFDPGDAGACDGSGVLFLQRNGGIYRGSDTNDSRTRESELIPAGRAVDVQPFPYDDQTWVEVVACVKNVLAPYDLRVTDDDPGAAPHLSVVLTTEPTHVGLPSATQAAAPFACDGVARGIAFVFSGRLGDSAVLNCMAAVSETGHMAGLEHVVDCSDAMSEAPGCDLEDPARRYTDRGVRCGLAGPGRCMCGDPESQNGHQKALAAFGPCPGSTSPSP